ncbi:MAG: UDP-glucose/GDP-mannose dehydrogenase family protein [Candidatus Paceibacterota bacterium]
MKIIVIGTGYVGLVQGVCLAEIGYDVVCIDIDEQKIKNLKKGISPIYESGIEDLIFKNIKSGKIIFDVDFKKYLHESDIIFIAVGTPSDEKNRADLKAVFSLAEEIGKNLKKYTIVATKSTVPMGTNKKVKEIISKNYAGDFAVISNPEFLREGSAIEHFFNPDRIIIGYDKDEKAAKKVAELYNSLNSEVLITNLETAEMIKYASNSFLAVEISFINTIARLCEKVGADVELVSQGMKLDKRIGKRAFLSAGLGYGGSCFPKDVKALIQVLKDYQVDNNILETAEEINLTQRHYFILKVKKILGDLRNKKIAILGLAFKPGTDDMRESPAINIIEGLLSFGAKLIAYDPAAKENAKKLIPELLFSDTIEEACKNSDAVIIITDWQEFKKIDWKNIINKMKTPIIFDGRNMFSLEEMRKIGINYFSIGR